MVGLGLGFAEILMLALISGGMNSTDLVALVQPAHYFQTRQVELTFDNMIDMAGRDPRDPKTQVQQLIALRHLAEEATAFKKSPKYAAHRETLEKIAAGKHASDPLGFSQEYAQRVLQKLDNTKPPAAKSTSIRDDGLAWFPAEVTLALATDMRQVNVTGADPLRELRKLMPEPAKKEMYDHIEKAGNIRVERFAFGMAPGGGKEREQKLYFRFSGKGKQAWVANMFKTLDGGRMQETNSKAADGTPLTLLQTPNRAPIIMLVGDTDVLIVGHMRDQQKHEDLANAVLDARAKKIPNATAGALKAPLAKIPDRAVAFIVGQVPAEMSREFQFMLGAVPAQVHAFVERTQLGLDIQVEGAFANGDDAKKVVQKVSGLKQEGIKALQQAMGQPLPPNFPQIPFQSLINVLESLQVQGDGGKTQVRVVVPDSLIQQIGQMALIFGAVRGGHDIAPPPKVDEK